MSYKKLSQFLRIGLLTTMCLSLSQALAQDPNDPSPAVLATVDEQLDIIANQLSQKLLLDDFTRELIWAETQVAPSPQHKVDLREIIETAQVLDPLHDPEDPIWESISDAMDEVDNALEDPLKEPGESMPADFRLYFPVDEHRTKWDGGVDLLVLSPPVDDNDVTAEIVAYSVAEQNRVVLKRDDPPETPTCVIGLREPDPEDETPPPPVIDLMNSSGTRLGIPLVLITNDSEPWYRGDPELYVKVYRWRSNGDQLQTVKKNLGYVNDTHRWYWIGDPGALYFPFTSYYGNMIRYKFMEDDWPDGDDHMGTLDIYRHQISLCADYRLYSHYRIRAFGDID